MYSDELYHYGVKGMKWGVRRYQNKDGSLTRAGKKQIRKDLRDADISKKYKTMKNAQQKHEINIEKVFKNKPDDYKESKEDKQKLDKSFNYSMRKTDDYYKTVDKVVDKFLNTYGNKRVSDVKTITENGRKEVNNLLRASEKDSSIWNKNIKTVRRYNAYDDLKRLQDENFNKDVYDQIDRVYKKQYGETINSSRVTKESQKKWAKHWKDRVKNNKKNGYY